jgi:AraC-like DNA-binding protein
LNLFHFLQTHPLVPYIRQSDYAVRSSYYLPARRLLDYLFIYIRKGELLITADGIGYRFISGEYCLLQPGTIHDLRSVHDNETPYMHLDIFYNPERELSFPTKPGQLDLSEYQQFLQPKLNDFDGLSVPVRLQPTQPQQYSDLLSKTMECWLSPDPLMKLEAQNHAAVLMTEIIRDHSENLKIRYAQQHPLDWIDSYLSFHLAEPITVEDMASRAHLSPSRFRELFRTHFGIAPHQYLIRLRISHARELLGKSNLTLAEIAEYCGFSDVFHFAKAFKARVGITPGSYREHSRAGGG